ncbi:MAG: hypothetical protein GY711_05275 [bacterium]|nr:hypothetical protein [bacterium]
MIIRYAISVLASAFLACACSSLTPIDPEWVDGQVQTRSEKVLYDAILISLRKADYPVGMGADSGARKVVSGWLNSASPFKGKGYRQKATVTYEPVGADRFQVNVRVEREINDSFRPLDPSMADFKPAPDDTAHARVVLQFIVSNVGAPPMEIGDPNRPR